MGESEPLVSVIVVSFNGIRLLPACLESLHTQTYPRREVVLVDNASIDGSVEWVRDRFPDVRIVRNETNRGFAAGCNAGIAVAEGSIIATLNSDAVAGSGWIENGVAAFQDRPDVGMVASRVVFARHPEVVESAGIGLDRAGVAWDRLNGEPLAAAADAAEVFGPSGGAALYRRELLDDVGGFDEAYFLYLEDVDLAWRAQLAGWRCWYAPDARVVHQHSATSGAHSAFKRRLLARNRIRLIAKNYPAELLWLTFPLVVGYDVAVVLAAAVLSFTASDCAWRAAVEGRLAGLRALPDALRERHEARARRRVPRWRFESRLDPLAGPAARLRRFGRLERLTRPIPGEESVRHR